MGVLATLCSFACVLLVVLTYSACKARRFLTQKDRIMLGNFVFLELTLASKYLRSDLLIIAKMLTLLLGALYYSNYLPLEFPWSLVIVIENLSFLFFFVACCFNLFKWALLTLRLDFYGRFERARFNKRRKFIYLVFGCAMTCVFLAALVLIAIAGAYNIQHVN